MQTTQDQTIFGSALFYLLVQLILVDGVTLLVSHWQHIVALNDWLEDLLLQDFQRDIGRAAPLHLYNLLLT